MIKSITLAVSAILLGIIVSPLLAVAVGVTVSFCAFVEFWIGLIGSIKTQKNTENPNQTQIQSIWDKHAKDKHLYEDEPVEKAE